MTDTRTITLDADIIRRALAGQTTAEDSDIIERAYRAALIESNDEAMSPIYEIHLKSGDQWLRVFQYVTEDTLEQVMAGFRASHKGRQCRLVRQTGVVVMGWCD